MRFLKILFLLSISISAFCGDYWLFLKDKGNAKLTHEVSKKTLERYSKAGYTSGYQDAPIFKDYIISLENEGYLIKGKSKWLNAVVVELEHNTKSLPDFVVDTKKVTTYKHKYAPDRIPREVEVYQDSTYGSAFAQQDELGVITMHENGYRGEGVLIAIFDSGFRLTHPAFDSLDVLATWDFINDSPFVGTLEHEDPTQHNHGTKVLAAIAGYEPGLFVGPATKATYVLGKTEVIGSESEIEEYNWVEAVEWADSIGVDIISSSLGYIDWYDFLNLDGDQAITTNIADLAAQRGILMINSAGNERGDSPSDFNHITPPADADSILSVGALNIDGSYANFSSQGPTYDGRIKPEVCARGYGFVTLNPNDTISSSISISSGTSYACPLIAGMSALVLQALRDTGDETIGYDLALRIMNTADMHEDPDNDYGWGLPLAPVAAGMSDALYITCRDSLDDILEVRNLQLTTPDTIVSTEANPRGVYAYYPLVSGSYNLIIPGFDGYSAIDTSYEYSSESIEDYIIFRLNSGNSSFNVDLITYPNPSNGQLYIDNPIDPLANLYLSIFLFDSYGTPCMEKQDSLKYDIREPVELELKNNHDEKLSSGIYLLKVLVSDDSGRELDEYNETVIIK